MAFWKRTAKAPEVRLAGRATVLEVGGSVDQRQQSAVSVRLRLRVDPVDESAFAPYEVTTAWKVATGLVNKVADGARWKVDVVQDAWEQVHPRDGRCSWDRTRTPENPKIVQI